MRCPKCGYISFDKITSCSQCETDVTELASILNGTGFQPMNNFFLGTLLPDYINNLDTEPSALQDAADDLDISVDDLDHLGDIGDIPGETGGFDLGFGDDEDDDTALSLHDIEVPEVDLSDFDEDLDTVDTMQISSEQLAEMHAQSEPEEEHIDLVDVPDFDLSGVDLDAETGDDAFAGFSDEEIGDVDVSVEEMPSLSLEMEDAEEKTEILSAEDLELDEKEQGSPLDLAEIDLSLGEDESGDDDGVDLADLDLGDLEMESKDDDLPDLKL